MNIDVSNEFSGKSGFDQNGRSNKTEIQSLAKVRFSVSLESVGKTLSVGLRGKPLTMNESEIG